MVFRYYMEDVDEGVPEDTQTPRAPRTCKALGLQHSGPSSSQEPVVSLARSLYLAAPGSLPSPSLLVAHFGSFFPKLAFPKSHSVPLGNMPFLIVYPGITE